MKKTTCALALLLLVMPLFTLAYTFSISGHVAGINDGVPVPGHAVYLSSMDSTNGSAVFYMAYTDSNGYYSTSIEITNGLVIPILVYTQENCPPFDYVMKSVTSSTTPAVVDFLICTGGENPDYCFAMFDYYFSDTMATIPENIAVQFNDYSYPQAVSWLWNFGDGQTSAEQNPVHVFPVWGVYEVCLSITTGEGCTNSLCMPVYTYIDTFPDPDCYTYFGYNNYADPTADPNTVEFYDYSYPSPVSWVWEFGDGTTGNEQNPVHTYQEQGLYYVTLSATMADSCSSTYSQPVYVGYNDSIFWPECQAMFYSYPNDSIYTFAEGYPTSFVDVSYGDPIVWNWDFGDGFTSHERNPMHIYARPGVYDVSLGIETATGCTSEINMPVWIWNYYNDSTDYWWCMANFYALRDSMSGAPAFHFYDQSFGNIVTWNWDFGDGTSSSIQNPAHTFSYEADIYWVTLTVSSSDGCASTITNPVFANDSIWIIFNGESTGYSNYFWLPVDTCLNGFNMNLRPDSTAISYYYLIDSSHVSVTWKLWQAGIPYVVISTYPVPGEGNMMLYLTLRCNQDKSSNIITISGTIKVDYSTLNVKPAAGDSFMVRIYPNPVEKELNVNILNCKSPEVNIEVFDAIGKLRVSQTCHRPQGGSILISTEDLPHGIYFVRVSAGNDMKIIKFSK